MGSVKNLWYAVLDDKEVKKNKPIGVTRLSQKLVLWRDEKNQINFIHDQYCHRGASLNKGKVVEAYGLIWIYNGDPDGDIPEIPFFNELRTGYAYSTFSEVWPVHYTRAAENQLDVVHLPFVHETTIGRGLRKFIPSSVPDA